MFRRFHCIRRGSYESSLTGHMAAVNRPNSNSNSEGAVNMTTAAN
jgi:hypothetical protein